MVIWGWMWTCPFVFQSSPPREEGCYVSRWLGHHSITVTLSILTPP